MTLIVPWMEPWLEHLNKEENDFAGWLPACLDEDRSTNDTTSIGANKGIIWCTPPVQQSCNCEGLCRQEMPTADFLVPGSIPHLLCLRWNDLFNMLVASSGPYPGNAYFSLSNARIWAWGPKRSVHLQMGLYDWATPSPHGLDTGGQNIRSLLLADTSDSTSMMCWCTRWRPKLDLLRSLSWVSWPIWYGGCISSILSLHANIIWPWQYIAINGLPVVP